MRIALREVVPIEGAEQVEVLVGNGALGDEAGEEHARLRQLGEAGAFPWDGGRRHPPGERVP
jgi:hypothetical protein